MTDADWRRVIDEGSQLGVKMVQFIGGEPTLHPGLPALVDHAQRRALTIEPAGVRLATSYYADSSEQHDAITKRHGSHLRTKTNIVEAIRRSIPIRVGLINIGERQRVDEAQARITSPRRDRKSAPITYGKSAVVYVTRSQVFPNSAAVVPAARWR